MTLNLSPIFAQHFVLSITWYSFKESFIVMFSSLIESNVSKELSFGLNLTLKVCGL